MKTKSIKPKKPADLSDEYWGRLSDSDKALYERIRPVVAASYEIDVGLHQIESFLKEQEEAMRSMGGLLELEPDYQRGHVWTHEQRVRYVESLIRGRAPRLVMFNCPGWTRGKQLGDIPGHHFQCIDGLQRLTTLRMFMRDEVQVFDGLTATALSGTPFDPKRLRIRVGVYEFVTRVELLQFYLDLNAGGTVHPKEELDRVRALLTQANH
ncbi:DUF262 domain-containing protein [Duganella vulcania]|uniref:DUF262 domain-containing protein n=1 Tax=Duganella vulcania TaxID=2692166 RepID=A0A845GIE3_9BURK|nr:DUF262 domain-containing protein [Duganella vulcania]MYM92537.1 DUF262 domain-containing protein [Duganella vulcania]